MMVTNRAGGVPRLMRAVRKPEEHRAAGADGRVYCAGDVAQPSSRDGRVVRVTGATAGAELDTRIRTKQELAPAAPVVDRVAGRAQSLSDPASPEPAQRAPAVDLSTQLDRPANRSANVEHGNATLGQGAVGPPKPPSVRAESDLTRRVLVAPARAEATLDVGSLRGRARAGLSFTAISSRRTSSFAPTGC